VAIRPAAKLLGAAALVALGLVLGGGGASAVAGDVGTVNWTGWGNTPNQNRYSPLTQITPANVGQLGRVFTADLNRFVPGIKKGQQSYPLAVDGTLYVTSADDQVFAVNGATGDLLWRYAPDNLAVFKNFGIVANRGLAYCDRRLFLLTLDMTIVALDPANGNQLARVPIGRAVQNAYPSYGYSETSAPICVNHTVVVGAAGSDYGVRGFVMAYHTDLTPAWANPFWIIPPAGTDWRKAARLVGGCTNWTPQTLDTTTNTLYFGTAAASPAYYPSLRPGSDPRCTSLIAVDLATGKLKWWQQLLAVNEWAYDASQPPLVYTTTIGGKTRRVVSIATMEGMWFAFDAKSGAPIYQRVKVIDNVEHPSLQPGKPIAVYPSSLGGLNYSPASFDPQTHYVYNAAAETASVLEQQTPAQEKAQELLLGNTFLGLANGDFGTYLRNGWHDYGSVSAIDVATGKRAWKFNTPEPERGGPTTTAGGVGFVGGGDGYLRAFDTKSGEVLWKFQTGRQIAAGPTVYSLGGKEYVAITVGGTVTSSNGGTVASQLQVFGLGGGQTQSPSFGPMIRATASATTRAGPPRRRETTAEAPAVRGRAKTSSVVFPGALDIQPWDPNSSNTSDVQGHVMLAGKPVAGAVVRVNGWAAAPTDRSGAFTYPVDVTVPGRHIARVTSVAGARVDGRPLTAAQRRDVLGATGAVNVGYTVTNLSVHRGEAGIVVKGRLTIGKDGAPQPVGLYSYLLQGTITDANGNPVKGAVVTTRTNDHKFWTYSRPTGASGKYTSFLVAADQEGSDPVPMTVGVAVGAAAYAEPIVDFVDFAALKSATLNIQLPASPSTPLAKSSLNPQAFPGGVYNGTLVGVVADGHVITPLRVTWPDAKGNFELLLPNSARGLTVKLWEQQREFFSTSQARPGGPVDRSIYPKAPATDTPQGIATLKLPG
jgi:alcohol dehydrogenase (cytochrome c)